MPKKSTKSKSKRTTLKQKYKVIRKVKEHHKKKRKEENRLKRLGIKKKGPKDPGIPQAWPYKEDLIKEIEYEHEKIESAKEEQAEAKKARRAENKKLAKELMDAGHAAPTLAQLRALAETKEANYEEKKAAKLADELEKEANGADNDSSRRAYYKEFVKVVEISDVIIQVLDARDPLACRSPEVERFVRKMNPEKRVILLLNKIDLVPKENVMAWLTYFREEMPTVAFKCATSTGSTKLGSRAANFKSSGTALGGGEALGAETLLQMLKNYARNKNLKTAITVGIVGFPNVGKSSLINSLKRSRTAAAVGNTPGMTKVLKEISLDKQVKLIDSPGVVFASALGESVGAAALRNCVKVERLEDPIAPVHEITRRCPAEQLMLMYKTGRFVDVDDFLRQVARIQGKLKKGGIPDMKQAARVVLTDWNNGRIPYFTAPPERTKNKEYASAEVVVNWSEEFDADKVFADEASAVIAGLPENEDDGDFVPMQSLGGGLIEAHDLSDDDDDDMADDMAHDDVSDDATHAAVRAERDPTEAGRTARALKQAEMKQATKASLTRQKVLYGNEGQYNPNQARAAKKRARREAKAVEEAAADDSGSDFDFDDDME
jgi:nuclear GTP-binding protein|mmetsp:Transcript_217/g.553  ORF Transcript_217/g.553 Transcript_217/m.553 type:complete len:605 (-) Transcript_217:49-1863(-)